MKNSATLAHPWPAGVHLPAHLVGSTSYYVEAGYADVVAIKLHPAKIALELVHLKYA